MARKLTTMRVKNSSYEPLAGEYYEERHITSRNFDAATLANLRTHRLPVPQQGLVLELGAGRGGAGKYLGVQGERVIQCDLSLAMLRFVPREPSAVRIQADALQLPFRNGAFAIVAAFLYDPYNQPSLYMEIGRVLEQRGIFVGTIPHLGWGRAVRPLRGHEVNKARFVTRTGATLERDSFLLPDEEVKRLLEGSGMEIQVERDLVLPRDVERISPDILVPASALGLDPHELPIVKLVTARKI